MPKCSRQTLCDKADCEKCQTNSFASHPKAAFWSAKNTFSPRTVFRSDKKNPVWFDCTVCRHSFKTLLINVTNSNTWCTFCGNKELCNDDNCAVCFEKSFASHPEAKNWHPDNDVTPRQVFKNANKKYWIQCTKCPHAFEAQLNNVNNDKGCHFCCTNGRLCEDECDYCFKRSFASHPRAKYWSPKNGFAPRVVLTTSTKKYTFDCGECGHDFTAILRSVTSTTDPTWCPYCGNKELCDKECDTCFKKSFASHPMSAYWHDNGELTPRQVFKNCNKKYTFLCKDCSHTFSTRVSHVTKKIRPTWCPHCKHKTALMVHDFLKKQYANYTVKSETKYPWCVNKTTDRKCSYDFEIMELGIIIELDGPQHFEQISNWGDVASTVAKDIFKMEQANQNGRTIVRLMQEDVFYNSLDWRNELILQIHKYDIPTRVFICASDEYKNHKKQIVNE